MVCDKCESEMVGVRCVCGWESPGALAVVPLVRKLPWHLCGWIASPGRTCQVPTGVARSESERAMLRAPKFCAYHQHRERLSLYGTFKSEEQAFLDWVAQFAPGTRYQPTPGIWDGDREQLWAMVSGQCTWDHFQRTMSVARRG